MAEIKSSGQIAYEGFYQRSGGKDLLTNAPLPAWNAPSVNHEGWEAAAESVKVQCLGQAPTPPKPEPAPEPPKPVEMPKLVPKAQTQTLPVKPKL